MVRAYCSFECGKRLLSIRQNSVLGFYYFKELSTIFVFKFKRWLGRVSSLVLILLY